MHTFLSFTEFLKIKLLKKLLKKTISVSNDLDPDLALKMVGPRCRLLLPLWNSVIVLGFVVPYFVSILVLQSS